MHGSFHDIQTLQKELFDLIWNRSACASQVCEHVVVNKLRLRATPPPSFHQSQTARRLTNIRKVMKEQYMYILYHVTHSYDTCILGVWCSIGH